MSMIEFDNEKYKIVELLQEIHNAIYVQNKDVLTTKEAAVFLGTTPQVLRKMASQGRISYTNPEGGLKTKYYFLKSDLINYMAKGRVCALK